MPNKQSTFQSLDVIKLPQQKNKTQLNHESRRFLKTRKSQLVFFVFLVVIGSVLFFLYRIVQDHNVPKSGAAELRLVESKISKHYLLPTNEVPALATVTDNEKLTSPYLKNAKDGDQVLIYLNNHIAIVYRPSIDRIVAVVPVNIGSTSSPTNSP